jgi:hypothetical protein
MDASMMGAATQLLYVKLAIKRGDWRDLHRQGAEPTPTMKLLFLKGREKYVAWRTRRDEEEAREEALPKEWFELEPGHWVRASSIEKARALAESLKSHEVIEAEERERRSPEIDTSKTCPSCKLRRIELGKSLCGNCVELGYRP